jgi:predicted glutamine amidotransferase
LEKRQTMCLIVERKKGQTLTKEFFDNVWKRNNDGWGIMWVSGKGARKKAKASKGLTFDKFWETFNNLQNADVPCMVHMRYNTHGDTNIDMCHPFKVADGVYMMHNGVVDVVTEDYNQKNSDTWAFVDQLVKPMLNNGGEPGNIIRDERFLFIMKKVIGTTNRMVFLDKDGPVFVRTGNWSKTMDDVIVSNNYAFSCNYATKPNYVAPRVPAKSIDNRQDFWDGYYERNGTAYSRGYWDSQRGVWVEGTRDNVTPIAGATHSGYKAPDNKAVNVIPASGSTANAANAADNGAGDSEVEDGGKSRVVQNVAASHRVGGGVATNVALKEPLMAEQVDLSPDREVELVEIVDEDDMMMQHVMYLQQDKDYAEELAYQDPELAAKVLQYLADSEY